MGWIAYLLATSAPLERRPLGYVWLTYIFLGLSLMTRSGQQVSSGDDEGGGSDPESVSTPAEQRDRALFNFLLYTAAGAIGIVVASASDRTGHGDSGPKVTGAL